MATVPTSEDDQDEAILGEAAHRAIQRKYPLLRRAVTKEDVPEWLYSDGLLSKNTFEVQQNVGLSETEKGRRILTEVQDTVKYNPKLFPKFCVILKKYGHKCTSLIDDLEDVCKDEIKRLSQKSSETWDSLIENLARLRSDFDKENSPEESLKKLFEFKVQSYIDDSLSNGATKEELDEELYALCYELMLVPTDLCNWVVSRTKEVNFIPKMSLPAAQEDVRDENEKTVSVPLPPMSVSDLKDVLYHSSLCCHAVTSCPDSYPDFFAKSGHKFGEMSMSISDDLQRCLIANREDTMYVAFKSEASLTDWMDAKTGYKSFNQGLDKQSSRISYAFFFEHLQKQKKIVFTGFSFGGMLACYVTATLWKESYIPVTDLEKNVVCVTYGQPLIKVPLVEQVIKDFDHFQDTVYHVFDREDIFPRVLRYYSYEKCDSTNGGMTALPSSSSSTSDSVAISVEGPVKDCDSGATQEFSQPFSQRFLGHLSVLQKEEMSYSAKVRTSSSTSALSASAVQKLKEDLSVSKPKVEAEVNVPCGRYCYVTSHRQGQGSAWTEFPSKELAAQMLHSVPDAFDANAFTKHDMKQYLKKLWNSFLDTEPDCYVIPSSSTKDVKKVELLKPNVRAAHIHVYPSEHAVVLEGENLSFCYAVQLGEMKNVLKIDTPALITPNMIRFNFPPNDKTRQIKVRKSDKTMKVVLFSHFSKRIQQRVEVNEELFSFSLRQIQLAHYTPAEVIQLAFMSALLERRSCLPKTQEPSQRLKTIANFLQEVVKVVPLESVFYAISDLDDDTALECAKAVTISRLKFPNSAQTRGAAMLAACRMGTGVTGLSFSGLANFAMSTIGRGQISPANSDVVNVGFPDQNTLKITIVPHSSYSAAAKNTFSLPDPMLFNPAQGQVLGINCDLDLRRFPRSKQVHPSIADQISRLSKPPLRELDNSVPFCKLSIEHIYPVDSLRRYTMTTSTLESPRDVLQKAREKLQVFLEDSQAESDSKLTNEDMLDLVRDIYDHKLKFCASLLAAFMEANIRIPLLKDSSVTTANILSVNSSPVAVGVWALFSFKHLQSMLASTRGNPLMVEIADYIAGVLSDDIKKPSGRSSKYDGKLQFLVQGFSNKRVSCSTEYVSYSLEHQLCKNLKFDKTISVNRLVEEWDKIFKGDALSLIAKSYRYTTARWLKWAVLIHDLRLSLASYTCIGVTGLVNSGKSQLVKKLFGVQTRVGTLEKTRTTVPLLYNLDGIVDGLDVIDFPGVDDKENNVPKLAEMLLGLAQVVVFVCDFRRIFTDQARQWLEQLKDRDVPVVVCLTFADQLYMHFIEEDNGDTKPSEFKRRQIKQELELKVKKIGRHVSQEIGFYCFHVPAGYNKEVNAINLKEMGVDTPLDVGHELVKIFRKKLKQEDVAEKLRDHVLKLQQSKGTGKDTSELPSHDSNHGTKDVSTPVADSSPTRKVSSSFKQPTPYKSYSGKGYDSSTRPQTNPDSTFVSTTAAYPHLDPTNEWFDKLGLAKKDIETLNREGFTTKRGFKKLTREDFLTLGLTLGGRRILEDHVEQKEEETPASQHLATTDGLDPNSHLRYVYKHTIGACTKWCNIGLQLGLPKHTLDTIARNTSLHDDSERYREMLTRWMEGRCAKTEELLEVLEGVTVGMKNVADAARALSEDEKRLIEL